MTALEHTFGEFAARRGLADAGDQRVEALTPLLARAEGNPLTPALRGRLAHGGEAVIGLLRYSGGQAVGADSDTSFAFLVAITRVAESEPLVPRLFCRRRGRAESASHMGMELDDEAVWTESEALAARYEVVTSPYQDPNWMRQLFAPAFIDWLVTEPPSGFAFELAYGDLVGSLDAAQSSPAILGALWDCTGAVAERIRSECEEAT